MYEGGQVKDAAYLAFDRVSKRFGDVPVVSETTLAIARNSFTIFLGPSGCGKTTLMRMVGGLDSPSAGVIRLAGEVITQPDRRRGMVFQSYSSFPWLTVEGNIAFGMRYRDDLSDEQRAARVDHYLKLIGMTDFRKSYPNRISGGMRQRVAIARTLAAGSDVLLMDEPFGALDPVIRAKAQMDLLKIQRQLGVTIVLVTHDMDEAFLLGNTIAIMHQSGSIGGHVCTIRPARNRLII